MKQHRGEGLLLAGLALFIVAGVAMILAGFGGLSTWLSLAGGICSFVAVAWMRYRAGPGS